MNSRRDFLKKCRACLIVGFSIAGQWEDWPRKIRLILRGWWIATQVDSWLSIAADESITAYLWQD